MKFPVILLAFTLAFTCSEDIEKKIIQAGKWVDEGKFNAAIQLYQSILQNPSEIDGKSRARIYNNIGFCFFKQGDYEQACRNYTEALNLDDGYFLCLNNMPAALMKQKKYAEALPYLDRAYRIDPKYIKVVFNLFVVHARLKNEEQAKLFLRQALTLDKNYTVKRLKNKNISDKQIDQIIARLEE